MSGAKIDNLLRLHAGTESVSNAARKSIAAANAIFDFHIFKLPRLKKLPVIPKNSAPIVDQSALHFTQCRTNRFDTRERFHDAFDYSFIVFDRQFLEIRIGAFDFKAEHFLEILLIPDQYL